MKTLIVEDDFTNRFMMQDLLSQFGEVRIAVNGREAVEAFEAARTGGVPYDLICLDIMMPEMDGHATLKKVREIEEASRVPAEQAVKIIMMTALSDTENIVTAYHRLCNGYLVKPIDTTKLIDHLKGLKLTS